MRVYARPGMVTLCDRDLADFGFTVRSAPTLVGTFAQTHPTTPLAGLAGQIPAGRDATVDATVISIDVTCAADTRTEMVTALDDLAAWCSLGPLELSTAFDWTKVALVEYQGTTLSVMGPRQFRGRTWQGTLPFRRLNPYTYDRSPRRVCTSGAGSANRVEVETGNAPSHAILWLLDATTATITQRDASGNIVRQSTLLTTQASTDALVVDGARSKLIKYVAGTRSEVPKDLTLGHGFVRLEPRFAHREAQRWQTLETSSGRLLVDYVRAWQR